jgi:hypothetical protein
MASPLDRRLEKLLATLAARLGESFEIAICLSADEEDNDIGELAEALVSAGLLLPAEPAGAVICDGCERNCAMPIEIAPAINGRPSRAFIVCDKRDDIGRVRMEPARLRRWTFSLSLLARALAKALKSDQEPAQEGEIWLLGNAKVGRNITQVTLARRDQDAPRGAQLAIVLAGAAQANAGRWITLENAFSLRDGRLTPRAELLRAPALSHLYNDSITTQPSLLRSGSTLARCCCSTASRVHRRRSRPPISILKRIGYSKFCTPILAKCFLDRN